MTREEAISLLTQVNKLLVNSNSWLENTHEPLNMAFDMAIKALEQEPFINKPCVSSGVCEHDKNIVLDKIRAEITDCLKALDEIEKSGLNIYLPNEISGRRLTYQQCLKFIDKYKAETEIKPQESEG